MLETIVLSAVAFAGTNIDDLFISMFLFSASQTSAQRQGVVIGKYLGIGILTAFSLLGARGMQVFATHWIRFLGLVPVWLGVREIIRTLRGTGDETPPETNDQKWWLSTALITLASGADNIGVYIPLFSGFSLWQMAASVFTFLLMNGLWCLLAIRLVRLPLLYRWLERSKAVVVPAVYLLLGLYILL